MDCCNVDGVTANLNGPSASGKGRKQGQGAAGQDGLDSSSGQAAEAVQPAIQAMAAALGVDVATFQQMVSGNFGDFFRVASVPHAFSPHAFSPLRAAQCDLSKHVSTQGCQIFLGT
jgi:hypothetical protein